MILQDTITYKRNRAKLNIDIISTSQVNNPSQKNRTASSLAEIALKPLIHIS